MPEARNLSDSRQTGNARVYDMDVLAEKKITGAWKKRPLSSGSRIDGRYLQPETAEEPESLKKEKEKALLAEEKNRLKAEKSAVIRDRSQKNGFLPEFLVFTFICTLLLLLVISLSAQINEATKQVSDLQGRIIELSELEKDLTLKLGVKNDIRVIEEMASQEYGMVKSDNLAKEHVKIDNEDKVEVYEETETSGEVFSTVMSVIGGVFNDFFETIY